MQTNTLRTYTRRAFSLIEAAIVLGIVGLVIAGIWTAASALNENYKVRQTSEDIIFIVHNVQNNFTRADSDAMGTGQSLVPIALAAGWLPPTWVKNGMMSPPFSSTYNYIINWTGPPRFQIGFVGVPRTVCIKMIRNITGRFNALNSGYTLGSNTGGLADVTGNGNQTGTFPIADASIYCANPSQFYFTFGYTR